MGRTDISDADLGKVVGGSIIFNGAHTTCGHNRNDQYAVVDYDEVLAYIASTLGKMSEKQQIRNLVAQGWLVPLEQ